MDFNENTLNSIPCGILILSKTGTIFYFNEYLRSIFSSESEIINFSKTQLLEIINVNRDLFEDKIVNDTIYLNYVNTKKHLHYSIKKIKEKKNEFFLFAFTDISSLKNHITKLNDFFYSALINLKNPVINSFNEIENLIKNCADKNCLEKSKIDIVKQNATQLIDKIEELKINYIKNFHFASNQKKTNIKELITTIVNGMRFLKSNKNMNYKINFNEYDIHEVFIDPDMVKKAFVHLFEHMTRELNFISDDFDINISNIEHKLDIEIIFKINSFKIQNFDSSEIDRMILNIGGIFNISSESNIARINIRFPLFEESDKNGKINMAIIEDDIDILELYKAIFSDNNEMNIEYFDSAKVFLDKKRDFELLIVDLYMPEVSGFDLIKDYTKVNKECKIIIVSGAPPQSISSNSNNQIVDVLSKPIDIFSLMTTIKKAINLYEKED